VHGVHVTEDLSISLARQIEVIGEWNRARIASFVKDKFLTKWSDSVRAEHAAALDNQLKRDTIKTARRLPINTNKQYQVDVANSGNDDCLAGAKTKLEKALKDLAAMQVSIDKTFAAVREVQRAKRNRSFARMRIPRAT
jgi:hypothetical protein